MNRQLRLPLCILSATVVTLAGCCCSKPETRRALPILTPTTNSLPKIRPRPVAAPAAKKVRIPEVIKPYRVSRYEDPQNPNVLHEEHTVYRAETTPAWNTLPSADTDLPAATNASEISRHEKLAAELEAKIDQQNRLLAATSEQNDRLAEEIKKLQDKAPSRQIGSGVPPTDPPPPPLTPAVPPSISPIPAPPVPPTPDIPPVEKPMPAPAPSTNMPPAPWWQWWK